MCNHTTDLFEKVEATKNRSAKIFSDSEQFENSITEFQKDASELLEKVPHNFSFEN